MPKKILDGKELQGFVKERQAKQVLKLGKTPKLAIITDSSKEISNKYLSIKQDYGKDIGIQVDVITAGQLDLQEFIKKANLSHDAIIVQLPFESGSLQESLDLIDPKKDVDSLGAESEFESTSATAIMWLLNGYNVELEQGKKIVVVGQGKLVGKPLYQIMKRAEYGVEVVDEFTDNKQEVIYSADIVISAVGKPNTIKSASLKQGAVVVDAGTSTIEGRQVGDISEDVFIREDITITPKDKGGVGPLTVAALFDNVIIAAQK